LKIAGGKMKSIANNVTGQSMSRKSDVFPQGYSRPSTGSMCVRDCGLKIEHSRPLLRSAL